MAGVLLAGSAAAQDVPNPVLFATQVPNAADFATIGSTFANHMAGLQQAPRGGDLWIRYPDGSLRNLTAEAGFGSDGFQGADAIAVRDPAVHWSGLEAVFSMVIGAPDAQFQVQSYRWQLYEVSGLGQGEAVQITKVPNQPAQYNNVSPVYASDGRILFTSDRPRSGEAHLYPQHDEYESTATVTGVWKLDPASGALDLLGHAPSGSFDPIVDSYGRVLFTRWDHLQTDQQAEADEAAIDGGGATVFGTFDFSDESAAAARLDTRVDIYPEPRIAAAGGNLAGHRFNLFFPWMVNQDGSGEETLNHIGRHELHAFFDRSLQDDADLVDFNPAGRTNPNVALNLFQLAEDPQQPGRYLAIDAPEFATHAAGQLLRLQAPPGANPDDMVVEYLTPRSTEGTAPAPDHSGHYRNPLPLSDGSIIASHTSATGEDSNLGTPTLPDPAYDFRLTRLAPSGAFMAPVGLLVPGGIVETVSWFSPDVLVTYSGPLWELSPVEVRAAPVPPSTTAVQDAPELDAFAQAGVHRGTFLRFLREQGLGVLAVRDATSRDAADEQQPYNLAVPGGTQSVADDATTVHEIAWMQFFQADQLRGIGGIDDPSPGRRPVARLLSDPAAVQWNGTVPGAPAASRPIFDDGSLALFVPTRRALSWQSLAPDGTPVVRERYWISVQPGEVRGCDGCHGVNTANQAGLGAAQNTPLALVDLLQTWAATTGALFADGFDD